MSGVNINYFGLVPFNPDNLPETKWLFGQGSPRPVGFTLSEMMNLYWTVRSFRVSIFAQSFGDAFAALLAGATTGTLIETTVGLNNAINILSQGGGNLQGKTKVTNIYTLKNRVFPTPKSGKAGQETPAVGRSNYQQVASNLQQFNHTVQLTNKDPKYVIGQNNNVNEGTIAGAGPVHVLQQGISRIEINFSDIIYANNLYWPTIIITMPLITSALFNVTPLGQTTNFSSGSVIGGVNFRGNVINLYSTSQNLLGLVFGFGDVNIGTNCCDRFYYDNMDQERAENYCSDNCQENGLNP